MLTAIVRPTQFAFQASLLAGSRSTKSSAELAPVSMLCAQAITRSARENTLDKRKNTKSSQQEPNQSKSKSKSKKTNASRVSLQCLGVLEESDILSVGI